ncbi:zinc finger and BTB domain-containing protein 41-like isoform X19 [Leguminivora glycinivorella]|uniref:zinc finger and BTB domain-containing protein 41-like isoform X19 n=1 Tax=Leguminivora glycinivorella TaxID=1035111 RepID=UPI00200F8F24|nr:zinc finger and BTB domain-containing protein 41-like isoform X19 [Leguminivora glycinivorella]
MEGKSTDWVRGPSGPTVCRCCFAEGCYKDISTEYFWMGKKEVYCEMLTETFDLSIAFAQTSGPNSNSRLICEPCISRLRDASEFKKQVQECEKMFMQYLDPGRSTVEEIQLEITQEPMEKGVKLEPVKLEKNQSDDDFDDRGGFEDMDEDDLDDQPLTKLASKVPKKESVDLLDLLDNAKAEKRKSSTKAKASPAKKAKTKKETPKATVSKPKPEKKKKERNEDTTSVLMRAARRNAKLILLHSNVYPVKYHATALQCYVCFDSFDDPALLRAHIDTHTRAEKYDTLPSFLYNSHIPVDITDLSCNKCKETFDSLDNLAKHLKDAHRLNIDVSEFLGVVPLKLEKNRFQCVICSDLHRSLQSIIRHTAMHYYRYTCETCGRKFRTCPLLNSHIRSEHKVTYGKYFCTRCKMSFASAKAKADHMKTSKPCQSYVCKTCGERFKNWELREAHQVEAHNQEKRMYRCIECGEEFKYRTYLYRHFNSTHTDKYKCSICSKQYHNARELREHTATHTGDRPYACDMCDMKFTCKQGWKRHKVTHDDSKKSACPICNKLFTRRYRVKGHIEKNHPEANIS